MDHKKGKMKNKPKFKRQNSILSKLKEKWRKPKGLHSKLRLSKKGKGKKPNKGYGNKKDMKNKIDKKNFQYITNFRELDNAKKPIIISSRMGMNKKLEVINRAKKLNLQIINFKDVDKFLENVNKKKENILKAKSIKEDKKMQKVEKTKKNEQKELTKVEKESREKGEKKKVLEKGL